MPMPAKKTCWKAVSRKIEQPESAGLLSQVATMLSPAAGARSAVWRRVLERTTRRSIFITSLLRLLQGKWVAAFVLVALAVRLMPSVILAPRTIASSDVLLIPTGGELSVQIGDLWQRVTEEIALQPGMLLRTQDGEASIVYHDDGVIRLDRNTTVAMLDTADRVVPQTAAAIPTLELYTGRIWVQGLTPPHVQGIEIATTYGDITVHGGSVSIAEDDTVKVAVWDRRAIIEHNDQRAVLVSGERTELWEGNVFLTKRIAAIESGTPWTVQNLARDAVHRQEIAQLQHERRIAMAGILPTSRLYPVKRVAEAVDVFLSWSDESRAQKKLQYAEARLNEATALLEQDEPQQVALTLDAYRQMLEAVATGTGASSVTALLEQSLDAMSAEVAALLPGHESYVIKKAVLDARAALPDTVVGNEYIEGIVLVDGLSSLLAAAKDGEVSALQSGWIDLKSYLALLSIENGLDPETVKEARSILASLNTELQNLSAAGAGVNAQVLREVASYVPHEAEKTVAALSEEELMQIVTSIEERIFVYHMKRSRVNQFISELKALEGHPDHGRILRRLHLALPDGPEGFPERVRREVKRLQWQKAA